MAYSTALSILFSEITLLSRNQYEEDRKVVQEVGEASAEARRRRDCHVEFHHC
jgi:hypothetical protein